MITMNMKMYENIFLNLQKEETIVVELSKYKVNNQVRIFLLSIDHSISCVILLTFTVQCERQ